MAVLYTDSIYNIYVNMEGGGAFLKVPFKYFLVLHSTSILKCSIRVTIYANRVVTNRVPMCTI